jgi:hypothetical protein
VREEEGRDGVESGKAGRRDAAARVDEWGALECFDELPQDSFLSALA